MERLCAIFIMLLGISLFAGDVEEGKKLSSKKQYKEAAKLRYYVAHAQDKLSQKTF